MFNPQEILMMSLRSVFVLSLVLPSTLCMHAASSSLHAHDAHEKTWSPPGQFVLDIPQEKSNFRIRNLEWNTRVILAGQQRPDSTPSVHFTFARLDEGEDQPGTIVKSARSVTLTDDMIQEIVSCFAPDAEVMAWFHASDLPSGTGVSATYGAARGLSGRNVRFIEFDLQVDDDGMKRECRLFGAVLNQEEMLELQAYFSQMKSLLLRLQAYRDTGVFKTS